MKRIIILLLCCVFMLAFVACGATEKKEFLMEDQDYIDLSSRYDGESFAYNKSLWYMNRLEVIPLPDPFVYVEDDLYYIVGTSDRNVNVVDCYVTEDFVTYELHKDIYDPALYNGWENENAAVYAPEIYCFDGVYYMYYSANDEAGVRRCSVVVADHPAGPYRPLVNDEVDGLNAPLFRNENHPARALDATVFTDDNGKRYMYFTVTEDTQHIVGVELLSPYEADWSTYQTLVIPGTVDSVGEEILLEWEVYRDNKVKIAEAPFMLKSQGKYYLTYSVNGCWNKYYNVCYAVSDGPLGNFVKPYEEGKQWTNLLLGYPGENDSESTLFNQWSGFASGTGHHCFFYAGDQLMIGYHAHQNRNWDSNAYTPRYFAFDYVHFDDSGIPVCNGPTYSAVALPQSISGVKNIVPDAKITSQNVEGAQKVQDNYIVDCYNLETQSDEVILGAGKSWIELEFDKDYEIKGIAVINSAYYDRYIVEIEYIDFGNGNVIYYPQFCEDFYVCAEKEFVYPGSSFNLEILKSFKADSVKIGFHLPVGGSINEIVILGK